jgi:hypothetical protein
VHRKGASPASCPTGGVQGSPIDADLWRSSFETDLHLKKIGRFRDKSGSSTVNMP